MEKFDRSKELLIEHLMLQMETYFMASKIPVKSIVGIMFQKIALKHFDEIRPYI